MKLFRVFTRPITWNPTGREYDTKIIVEDNVIKIVINEAEPVNSVDLEVSILQLI